MLDQKWLELECPPASNRELVTHFSQITKFLEEQKSMTHTVQTQVAQWSSRKNWQDQHPLFQICLYLRFKNLSQWKMLRLEKTKSNWPSQKEAYKLLKNHQHLQMEAQKEIYSWLNPFNRNLQVFSSPRNSINQIEVGAPEFNPPNFPTRMVPQKADRQCQMLRDSINS